MPRRSLFLWVVPLALAAVGPAVAAPDPAAVEAAIQRGADWLIARQNLDGSFGPPPLALRDSAAVLDALRAAGRSDRAVPAGLAWLAGARGAAIQFGSARALALAGAGRPFGALLQSLAVLRGAAGFGAQGAHEPNLFDTALAARALALEEPARLVEILPLVDYLLAHQNADGGWGFVPGETSDAYFTAAVATTLASLERLAVAAGSLDAAAAFLASRQQLDGGFGGSLETAEVYGALLALGFPTPSLAASPVAFLLSRQRPEGSWEGEPFVTGRVIAALSRELPNLALVEASAPASVGVGEPVPLEVTVRNTGPAAAAAGVVAVREDGTLLLEMPLAPLAPATEASFSAEIETGERSGELELRVAIDPADEIEELDETDNEGTVRIGLRGPGDLAVFSADLQPSPPTPRPGADFFLRIGVRNLGESTVERFVYRLSLVPEEGEPVVLSEGPAGPAPPGAGVPIAVPLNLARGAHRLLAEVDPGDEVFELSEANNRAERTVSVGADDLPDLLIDEREITVTPPRPEAGETVMIEVTARNEGEAPGDALLEVFAGEPETATAPVEARRLALPPRGAETVTAVFTMAPETVRITAVIDRPAEVGEADETNNRASLALVDRPNLAIGHDGLEWSLVEPIEGDAVDIAVTVRNAGTRRSGEAGLEVFDGDPEEGGIRLLDTRVAPLAAGANQAVSFTWTASGGLHDLVAVVDRGAQVEELSETDNRLLRRLAVARASGPDLQVAGIDVSRLEQSPLAPAIAGEVAVEVANGGNEDVLAAFDLRLYEDRDGDSRFAAGDRLLAEAEIAGGLPAGTSTTRVLGASSGVEFHRPLLRVEVDPADAVRERREDDNQRRLPGPCAIDAAPGIEPRQEWYLPDLEVESVPVVAQVTDDDRNGAIDSRDVPDVVFVTETAAGPAITARSGLDGSEHWTLDSTPELPLASRLAHLAAADLDGDGIAEVLGVSADRRILALDHRGRVLWVSERIESAGGRLWAGGMAVGDLSGDGSPEIALGRTVLSAGGDVVAAGTANTGRNRNFFGPLGVPYLLDAPLSVIADVDLDGASELIAGDAVYRLEGNALRVVWDRSVPDRLMEDGYVAVGDLDADPEAEIVYVSSNRVMLLHHDGTVLAEPREVSPLRSAAEATVWAGPPSLADLDGDGRPEILVPAHRELVAFESDLAVLWRRTTSDRSEQAGAVGFDLDGDGLAEVLYADETDFYILAGPTGEVLHRQPNRSKTGTEYPVVADVDGDGIAEVLVASNEGFDGDRSTRGLHLLGHPGWRATRSVWNQHSYHATNIGLDGTVPAAERPSWRTLNSYRSNVELPRRRQSLANLTVGVPRSGAAGALGVPVRLRVGNGGAAWAPAGVAVALHQGDPETSPVVGSAVTTRALAPGDWEDVVAFWQAPGTGLRSAVAAVDPGDRVAECDEGDNQIVFDLTESVLADLSIPAGGLRVGAPAVAGQVVPVSVTVTNAGAALSPPGEVRLYRGSPGLGRVEGSGPLPELAPDETALVQIPWEAPEPRRLVLHAVADPDDLVLEVSEENNTGLLLVEPEAGDRPDLALEGLAVLPDRAAAGETVQLEAAIRNRGAELPGGFEVAFLANGAEIGRARWLDRLAAGEGTTVRTDLATAGLGGQVEVAAIADPDGRLDEQNESNNRAAAELVVGETELALAIRTERPIYGPNETVRIEVAVDNATGKPRATLLVVEVLGPGRGRRTIVESVTLVVEPGLAARVLHWETGRSPSGAYRVTARLSEEGSVVAAAEATFGIQPATALDASLVVDPRVASPLERIRLTGVVVNGSPNQDFDRLVATLAVAAPTGETVFAGERAIEALAAETSRRISFVWPVDGAPAGVYSAVLRILDAAGRSRAVALQEIQVEDSADTGEGLRGSLGLLSSRLGAGAALEAEVTVTNGGNNAIDDLELRVDLVSLPDAHAGASSRLVLSLERGATASRKMEVQTTSLAPGDYLAALVASLPRSEVVLDSTPVAVESGLSVADATVEEGNAGSAWLEFAVSLEPAVERPVSVRFTTRDATARAGIDFVAASGTLGFPPGETERTVRVEVLGDLDPESDELVLLLLEGPSGALLADGLAVGRILDEEGCPGPELLANPDAEEGSASELPGWEVEDGAWRRREAQAASGAAHYQASGSGAAELAQQVDLRAYAASIDRGDQGFSLQGFVRSLSAAGGRLVLEFRDAAGVLLGASDSSPFENGGEWIAVEESAIAPPAARIARVRLLALGLDTPAAAVGFDRLSLRSIGTTALSLSAASASEGGGDGAGARFEIRLSCPLPGGVVIDYSTSDSTARAGLDYAAASGVLALTGQQGHGSVEVEILDDEIDEADEEFFLEVAATDDVAVIGGRARGLIFDDDAPVEMGVAGAVATEGDGSPAEVPFTVSLSAPSEQPVGVGFNTFDLSATEAEDYRRTAGELLFEPGEIERTVAVPLLDDDLEEPTEQLGLRLRNPVHARLETSEAAGIVLDDDPLSVSVGDTRLVEGDTGTREARFAVRLSRRSARAVQIGFVTADGEALAGEDYLATSGTLDFPPGSLEMPAAVAVVGDLEIEPLESFRLLLTSTSVGSLGDGEATGTIVDDDSIQIAIGDAAGIEGDGVETALAVTLSRTAESDLTVEYRTVEGSAAAGEDYRPVSGLLTVPAGSDSVSLTVELLADAIEEPLERFSVRLSAPSLGVLLDGEGEVTVIDDDGWVANGTAAISPLPGCLLLTPRETNRRGAAWRTTRLDLGRSFDRSFRVYLGDQDAGGEGMAFMLQAQGSEALSPGPGGLGVAGIAPSVAVEMDTQQQRGDPSFDHLAVDLNGVEDHAGWPPLAALDSGADLEDGAEHLLRVAWNAPMQQLDVHLDGSERLIWERDLVAEVFGGDPRVHWGFVGATDVAWNLQYFCPLDPCPPSGAVSLVSVGDVRIEEGEAGLRAARFAVTLSCPMAAEARVAFVTVDGTARAGEDYRPASGELVFPPGETALEIVVDVVGDAVEEPDESFEVHLSNPIGAELRRAEGVATIASDELPVTVGPLQIAEGDRSDLTVRLTARLASAPVERIALDFATRDGTAVTGSDFRRARGSLVFEPGEIARDFDFALLGDTAPEGDEELFLEITDPAGRVASFRKAIVLRDDDACPSANLLANPGAEEPPINGEIPGWVEVEGESWTRQGTYSPYEGEYYFQAGADELAELRQDVDLSSFGVAIDEGLEEFELLGQVTTFDLSGRDLSRVVLEYRDADNREVLDAFDSGEFDYQDRWRLVQDVRRPPAGSRWARLRLISRRQTGTSNDGNFDALVLRSLRRPTVSVDDLEIDEGSAGVRFAEFVVSLSCAAEGPASVDYFTRPGTAGAGTDYEPVLGTLVFAPGETRQVVLVPILGDTFNEGDEHFDLQLFNPAGAALARSRATAVIRDDESAIAVADVSLLEGAAGVESPARFQVRLSRPSEQAVTVEFSTADGTAVAAADYRPAAGTLSFAPGETVRDIEVAVIGDAESEPDETFFLELTQPRNAVLDRARARATILQDDLSVQVHDVSVREGDSEVLAAARVTLSEPSSGPVAVDFATEPLTAAAGEDYRDVAGSLSIPPGRLGGWIEVPVIGDAVAEPGEAFILRLSRPQGARLGRAEATGIILDDDDCPSPEMARNGGAEEPVEAGAIPGWTPISGSWRRQLAVEPPDDGRFHFASAPAPVAELRQEIDLSGFSRQIDAGIQRFLFSGYLRTPDRAAVSARIALEYRDEAGAALLSVFDTGGLSTEGRWRQVVDLHLPPPGARSVRLRLLAEGADGSGVEAAFDGLSLQATGTPALSIAGARQVEGDTGTTAADFAVSMTCASEGPATVDYATLEGTAVAGVDFAAVTGRLELEPGGTASAVTVSILGDTEDELAETFSVRLAEPVGAALFRPLAEGLILDDDAGLADAGGPYSGEEGSRITFDASGSSSSSGAIVSYAWDLDDDGAFDDFFGAVAERTYTEDGEYLVAVRVTDDSTRLDDDWSRVTVVNAPPAVDAGADRLFPEGALFGLEAIFDDPGLLDAHAARVDWGDGTRSPASAEGADGAGSVTASHSYADDGSFQVEVCVSDDDGATGCDDFALAILNRPPRVAHGEVDFREWTAESVEAPAPQPARWEVSADGRRVTQRANGEPTFFYGGISARGSRFGATVAVRTTRDDDFFGFALGFQPGDTVNPEADFLLVDWKRAEQSVGGCDGQSLLARPGLSLSRVTGIASPAEWSLHLDLPCVDPGQGLEELARGANLGDQGWTYGTEYAFSFELDDEGVKIFVDGVLELEVAGRFGEGRVALYDSSQAEVEFQAESAVSFEGFEGEPLRVSVSFVDDARLDTHTATVEWGDGEVVPGEVEQGSGTGQVTAEHRYAEDGSYTLAVCVTDDDGGQGCGSFPVWILNLPPVVEAGPDLQGVPGVEVALPPTTFRDSGTHDLHTASVDWGDGAGPRPAEIVEAGGSGAVFASHAYAMVGEYRVTVCVEDDERETACDFLTAVILPAPALRASLTDSLAVDRDGDGAASPGDGLAYRLEIANDGGATARDLEAAIPIPAHTALVEASVRASSGSVTGLDPIRLELEEFPAGALAWLTFESTIDDPVAAGVRQITAQGTVAAAATAPLLTDDPDLPGDRDATATPVAAAPELVVEKTDVLFADADADGRVSPGDVLLYMIRLANVGSTSATEVTVADEVPLHSTLVPGSIEAAGGTVVDEDPLRVDLGEIPGRSSRTLSYRVRIDDPFPSGSTGVSNQARVESAELDAVDSDDPDTEIPGDPTATEVVITPELSIGDATATESAATSGMEFELLLSTASNREVAVSYLTRDETARAAEDYLEASGRLAFLPGETSRTVTARGLDDALLEPDETYLVELSEVSGATLADGTGRGTLLDDELCPGPELLTNPGAEELADEEALPGWVVAQGAWERRFADPSPFAGEAYFVSEASQSSELRQDVDLSAYAGAIAAGGLQLRFRGRVRTAPGTPPGSARLVVEYRDGGNSVALDVFDSGELASPQQWMEVDDRREVPIGARWVRVRLLAGGSGDGSASVAYFDALELASLRVPVVVVGDAGAEEGDAGEGQAVFRARLSCASSLEARFNRATSDGTAVAGEDYAALPTALVAVPPGETLLEIPVAIWGDTRVEPDETFFLDLSAVEDAVLGRERGIGLILDDDAISFCPRSPGYWKNHREAWPLERLLLGGVTYDALEMMAFLRHGGRDATLNLARQLVAARLNLAAGSDPVILPTAEAADALLAEHPPGSDPSGKPRGTANRLKDELDHYNNTPCTED